MGIRTNFLALLFLALLASFQTVWATDNPFADRPLVIHGPGSTKGQAVQSLPAVSPGQRVIATVVVGSSLNVRTGPWGDVIGNFGPGAKITIVGQVGDWYKIEFNGKTAYVHSAYVQRPGEGSKPFPPAGWVNAPLGLNVRRVPLGDIIGKMKDQQAVEILGRAGDYYKIRWGDNEAFVSKKYIDTDQPSKPQTDDVTPMNFVGYVSAEIGLNVRNSPWGGIDLTLPYGAAVKVTGKIGDWYRISYNGKVRYVHANYIVKNKSELGGGTNPSGEPPTNAGSGTLQERVARAARSLIGSTRFRGREVDYGNLACAQVVSTALKNAGALDRVSLNVRSVVSDLHAKGWKEASVPPFHEGDVITWKTYDYTGDGVKDPDTHVGVIVKEGNSFMAMNNSSRLRTPRLSPPYSIGPVTRVLRKA